MMFFSPSPTPCGGSDLLLGDTYTLLSHFDDSLPAYEAFCFDIEEKSSGSTASHFDHSLSDYESFCFDDDHIEEKSSGSTTSQSDHSLLEYEAFCFDIDHIEEKSSGSTTTHFDLSLLEYESFHFNLSIDPFPPVDRSDFYREEVADELAHIISPPESDFYREEVADELAHIISPPEYDHFYFDLEDDPVELTRLFKENISEMLPKDPTRHELNDLRLLLSDYKVFDLRILIIDEVFLEVVRFDPFLSLTQSVSVTRVMETSSSGFHHMPSPRPAAYSPKEVMYRFYHPHLTSGDGFDHGPKMK
nr:hypothetical protein [Tanacetum cinerariifolium]